MEAGINYVKSTCGLEVRVRERIPRTDLMWDHACDDSNPIIKLNTRHVLLMDLSTTFRCRSLSF